MELPLFGNYRYKADIMFRSTGKFTSGVIDALIPASGNLFLLALAELYYTF